MDWFVHRIIDSGYASFSELATLLTLEDMLDIHLVLDAKATADALARSK